MNKTYFFIVSVILVSFGLKAQEGKPFEVKVQIDGLKDSICYLAGYYGPKQYYRDTAEVKNGKMVFRGDALKGGIYSVVIPSKSIYFEFILTEPKVSLKTKMGNQGEMNDAMEVIESDENKLFFKYLKFIAQNQNAIAPSRAILQDSLASDADKAKAKETVLKVDEIVKNYKIDIIKQYSTYFVSKIFTTSEEPEIPEYDKSDSLFPRRYFMAHFWDGVDFSDERLIRTPVLHNKLEKYITKLTIQHPDSINAAADIVVSKAKANKEIYKYVVHYVTNEYEKSKIMGMDAVFVHMAENYYMDGSAFWLDSTQLAKVTERASKLSPLLIGKRTPNVILQDTSQTKWISLYDVKARFTFLYFWDSGCGHCKKETPLLRDLYLKYKEKGYDVEVFAVGTEFEGKDWVAYIKKNELNWINVSDNPEINKNAYNYLPYTTIESLNFRDTYDLYSTPRLFLLDKDKKIIAKRLGVEQLEELLDKIYDKEEYN